MERDDIFEFDCFNGQAALFFRVARASLCPRYGEIRAYAGMSYFLAIVR